MPRLRPHWTPRYLFDRSRLMVWERLHPAAPWLVPGAVRDLARRVRPGHTVVEFGSGRSTAWFARLVGSAGRVVSVEHDPAWHARVRERLRREGLAQVDARLAPPTPDAYVGAAREALGDARAHLILVDGACRDACALWALHALRPGGVLVIDNCNRFYPSRTRSPASLGPADRSPTADWAAFQGRTAAWTARWWSSGVTDTLVLLAPAPGQG